MEAKPGYGIDQLLFGMTMDSVKKFFGEPSRTFKDEEQNEVWLYNEKMLRLTFYADESFRLGYLICSNPELKVSGKRLISERIHLAKEQLGPKFKSWETEMYDMTENHFNEDNWVILQAEFGIVTKVEIGAAIVNDEFVWRA